MSGKLCVSGAAGGGGTDGSAQPKTRTPPKDVGNYMDTEGKKRCCSLVIFSGSDCSAESNNGIRSTCLQQKPCGLDASPTQLYNRKGGTSSPCPNRSEDCRGKIVEQV